MKIFKIGILSVGLFLIITSFTRGYLGAERIHSFSEAEQGSLLVKTDQGYFQQLPLLDTQVELNVSGMIARATVKQFFQNQGQEFIEATYVFPLPEDSAVDHLTMTIGERHIVGKIKEKSEAKRIYIQAKKSGKKTALLEQKRANIFKTNVANIAPGEMVQITIEYQQLVHFESGVFSLRFPTAITPRYQPATILPEDSTVENSVTIDVNLDAGLPLKLIESPYHNITQQKKAQGQYQLSLKDYQISNKDFELRWQAESSNSPRVALFKETVNSQGAEDESAEYVLLMVTPPQATGFTPLPREMTFVIDQSGSMQGASMEQAILALQQALKKLSPEDKFNIIAFNHQMHSLFKGPVKASAYNLSRAHRYVGSLEAEGGTEMLPALKEVLSEQVSQGYIRQIIFLTDGAVSNEQELFSVIHRDLRSARLFTIGIGSAPNSYFMSKAAQFGRGSFTYIGKPTEVAEKMSALFEKLEKPVMKNVKVDWPTQVEQFPSLVPDLYLGEPLMLRVKAEQFSGEVQISGEQGSILWQASVPLGQNNRQQTFNKTTSSGIPVLWARAKISELMDQQLRASDKEAIRQQITDLALDHHLVSRYTSLVAVESKVSRPDFKNLKSRQLASHSPAANASQTFGYPATALGWKQQLLTGIMLLLLSLFLWQRHPRKRDPSVI
ncbi:MAG: marine proteobacterial sortase target protein [Gammaproteobacteria bacterium]|nr:MAG: marine proteobacterial sortase target protein [Gammaproteobacteria bacterium]